MREERVASGRPGIALAGEGRPAGLALRYPKDPLGARGCPSQPGSGKHGRGGIRARGGREWVPE